MGKLEYPTVEACKRLSKVELSMIMGIAEKTIFLWVKKGLPQRDDGKYNLTEVIKWKVDQAKADRGDNAKQAEELKKLQNQNTKLELEIANMEMKTIPRETVLEIFKKAETEIKVFMTDGFKKNALVLWAAIKKCKELHEFIEVLEVFWKSAMDNFVKSGKDLE